MLFVFSSVTSNIFSSFYYPMVRVFSITADLVVASSWDSSKMIGLVSLCRLHLKVTLFHQQVCNTVLLERTGKLLSSRLS